MQHFQAAFAPIAAKILYVSAPGRLSLRWRKFPGCVPIGNSGRAKLLLDQKSQVTLTWLVCHFFCIDYLPRIRNPALGLRLRLNCCHNRRPRPWFPLERAGTDRRVEQLIGDMCYHRQRPCAGLTAHNKCVIRGCNGWW